MGNRLSGGCFEHDTGSRQFVIRRWGVACLGVAEFCLRDVVHVVRDSAVRAAQKTHAPLTTAVSRGSLRSIEIADHAASSCKDAGRGVGPDFFAKVRVAGSSPVVRSRKTCWLAACGRLVPPGFGIPLGGRYHIRTTKYSVCPAVHQ
jgi:hypothetical protein